MTTESVAPVHPTPRIRRRHRSRPTSRHRAPGCARPSPPAAPAASSGASSSCGAGEADGARTRPRSPRRSAKDLDRNPFEAWLADIASTAGEAEDAAKNVAQVDAAQVPAAGGAAAARPRLGRVRALRHRADHRRLELSVRLTLGPAVGAIAAGNAVVLKPSEVAPASSRADGRAGAALPRQRCDRGDRGRRRGEPGADRAGLRPGDVHRRHRDRPQGLRGRGAAPDPGHPRAGRQEPGDRRRRRRRRRRRQADRLDQAAQLRPDLHRPRLRAGRREDPRRAGRQDRRRRRRSSQSEKPERDAHRQPASLRPARPLRSAATKGEVAVGGGSDAVEPARSSRPSSSTPIRTSR